MKAPFKRNGINNYETYRNVIVSIKLKNLEETLLKLLYS